MLGCSVGVMYARMVWEYIFEAGNRWFVAVLIWKGKIENQLQAGDVYIWLMVHVG
jgi:hypothetical protein